MASALARARAPAGAFALASVSPSDSHKPSYVCHSSIVSFEELEDFLSCLIDSMKSNEPDKQIVLVSRFAKLFFKTNIFPNNCHKLVSS